MAEELFCPKCKRTLKADNFYTYKDGAKTELCKKCLTLHVDNFDTETFLWILEKMDVPYIESEWNVLRDRAYAKDPNKMNGMSVLGRYLSKMKLKQWKQYSWADTERLALEASEKAYMYGQVHPEIKDLEDKVQEQFDKGEISEAEYKTFMSTSKQNEAAGPYGAAPSASPAGNPFNENNFIPQEQIDVGIDLTQEDKIYLAMKWGRMYQPHEWVEMEKNYTEMMESFDIQDADTINTLILLCKTNLKMNQAINQE